MRTPTWQEVEEFLRKDGWDHLGNTDHRFYRKLLPDGTLLETHTSFSGQKTMSPGRFLATLRDQLKVNQQEFWETLRTGNPAQRPGATTLELPTAYDAWVIDALSNQMRMSSDEILSLSAEEARQRVFEWWSRAGTHGSCN